MIGGTALIDVVTIDLESNSSDHLITVHIDVHDNSLSRKWLTALNHLLKKNYHLEKNYCFLGFADSPRNGLYLCRQINDCIAEINQARLGYQIDNVFTLENTLELIDPAVEPAEYERLDEQTRLSRLTLNQAQMNRLHKYFEDLQGTSGHMSKYYNRAEPTIRWHIRQLNLLCHEFESWALSYKKKIVAPEWQRPSQLMCWLHAPRFALDQEDYNLFGIETLNRPMGGVFVGVNKAIGKHHWEVFNDENKTIDELTTGVLRSQTEASGDFDIEWAKNPKDFYWQTQQLDDFRKWLISNGFDPEDPSLTIGHPQCGQVDLIKSFGSHNYTDIWNQLSNHANVVKITTSDASAKYDYNWDDKNYIDLQIERIQQGEKHELV